MMRKSVKTPRSFFSSLVMLAGIEVNHPFNGLGYGRLPHRCGANRPFNGDIVATRPPAAVDNHDERQTKRVSPAGMALSFYKLVEFDHLAILGSSTCDVLSRIVPNKRDKQSIIK